MMGRRGVWTIAAALLTVTLVAAAASCSSVPKPTIEGARRLAAEFMNSRLAGDVEAARARLGPDAKAAYAQPQAPALDLAGVGDVTGFSLVGESDLGSGHYSLSYRVFQVGRETAYAAYWDEVLAVSGASGAYTIDSAARGGAAYCRVKDDQALYLQQDGGERLLFEMADLPDQFAPLGGPDGFTVGVAKEGFVLVSFSPDASQIAFVTWGTHGFLGRCPLPAGPPAGIDVHWGGLAVDVEWSPDGTYLAAAIDAATGNQTLVVYRLQPRELVALGLETQFAPELYELRDAVWVTPTKLEFTVSLAEGGTDVNTGRWSADVGIREVRRITRQ